jgi:hypothetical protein
MFLSKMRCLTETNEAGADEPYVLVFAARLQKIANLVQVPAAATTLYGPWKNVDQGDLVDGGVSFGGKQVMPPKNFWGLDGKPQSIEDLDEVLIIAGVMENDDAETGGIRAALHAQLFASLTSYANAGMSRADMVGKLKRDMKDVLTGITVTGVPNNDDLVNVTEVRFPADALQKIAQGPVAETIELAGDGGRYRLRFEMSR